MKFNSKQDAPVVVVQLAQRCADQMSRYRRRQSFDPRHCYQLFRRALVGRDDQAWTAVYVQYGRLVRKWLRNTPGDSDMLVNQVFERF